MTSPPALYAPNGTRTRDDDFAADRLQRALGRPVPAPITIQLQ